MRGATWTLGVWLLLFLATAGLRRARGLRGRHTITRLELATAFAILGTHTFAHTSTAEDIIANPLPADRILRGMFAGAGLLLALTVLLPRIRQSPRVRRHGLTALTLYFGVAIISVLYSVAPTVSLGKVFELGGAMAILWAVSLAPEPAKEIRRLIGFVVALESSLVLAAILGFFLLPGSFVTVQQTRPGFLTRATMTSPYAHSNGLSAWGALLAAYGMARVLETRGWSSKSVWILAAAGGTLGMLLASGRQGLVIWAAALAVLLFFKRRTAFLVAIVPLCTLIVYLNWATIWSVVARNQSTSSLATLSGRTIWWASALGAWSQHPWLGYGFGAGGRFVALQRLGDSGVSSVHSGYVEAIVDVGLVGFVLLVYGVWRMTRYSLTHMTTDASLAILAVPLLLHTFVSLGFGAWLQSDFFLFGLLVLAADLTLAERRARSPSRFERPDHRLQQTGVAVARQPGGFET